MSVFKNELGRSPLPGAGLRWVRGTAGMERPSLGGSFLLLAFRQGVFHLRTEAGNLPGVLQLLFPRLHKHLE